MHMYVEDRGQNQVPFFSSYPPFESICFLETRFLIETRSSSIRLCWLARQRPHRSSYLYLITASFVGARDAVLVLQFASKHFCPAASHSHL